MSDNKGINTAVLAGRRVLRDDVAPGKERKNDGLSSHDEMDDTPAVAVDVVDESASAQPGSARPDGWQPSNQLPKGGRSYAQQGARETVRGVTARQLSQQSNLSRPSRRSGCR